MSGDRSASISPGGHFERGDSLLGVDLPGVRLRQARGHADRCLPVFLRMRALQGDAAAEGGGLLRVLLVRLGEMPAGAGRGRVLRAGPLRLLAAEDVEGRGLIGSLTCVAGASIRMLPGNPRRPGRRWPRGRCTGWRR